MTFEGFQGMPPAPASGVVVNLFDIEFLVGSERGQFFGKNTSSKNTLKFSKLFFLKVKLVR